VGVLVLTRRTNQSIVIGSDVIITIVEIREEVLEQIRDQNRKAAELVGNDASLLPRRSVAPAGGEPVAPSTARPARSKH
jgi:sRNA-binding carbon storage regulator CsrA